MTSARIMDYEDSDEIIEFIERIDKKDNLTDFEMDFISKLYESVQTYGKLTFLSSKQKSILDKLINKYFL